jgi:hypothetical protein
VVGRECLAQHIASRNFADNQIGMGDIHTTSPLHKFALPHQFQPRLSFFGAVVAIAAALARILLGSLIGALWGVQIWLAFASTHSAAWKVFAIFGMAAGLAVSLAALMWAVGKATMKLDPCAISSSAPPVT